VSVKTDTRSVHLAAGRSWIPGALVSLCFLACAAGAAAAQQEPAGATPENLHRFFDRTNVILSVAEGGALLADGIYTQRGLKRYPETSREVDPLARPFVSHGWTGQIVGGALVVAADLGIRYLFHRKNHHRIERLFPVIVITYGTAGAIHNARELRRADNVR